MSTHPSLSRLAHRPGSIPDRPWVWRQSWCDLLFAHWPVPAALLQPLVPTPLRVQEFQGTSWIRIVPFRMAGVMRRPHGLEISGPPALLHFSHRVDVVAWSPVAISG